MIKKIVKKLALRCFLIGIVIITSCSGQRVEAYDIYEEKLDVEMCDINNSEQTKRVVHKSCYFGKFKLNYNASKLTASFLTWSHPKRVRGKFTVAPLAGSVYQSKEN